MTRATITRKINVAAPPAPGDLPSAGAALLVASAEWYQSVRPAGLTSTQFNNAAFEAYGSGTFNPHYSTDGAFIACGSGGHGHAEMIGGLIYDFTTRSAIWRGTPGWTETGTPSQVEDTNGSPWYEMTGTEIPAPPHPWKNLCCLSPALGGGTKGSMIYVGRSAVCGAAVGSGSIHAFDAATGVWSRASSERLAYTTVEATSLLDPVTGRYYYIPYSIHDITSLEYFDANTGTIETTATFDWPTSGGGSYTTGVYCEVAGVRMILAFDGSTLQALDLDAPQDDWHPISYTGSLPSDDSNCWCWHEASGKLYHRVSSGAGQVLRRLTPPGSSPFSNQWAVDTVTLTGDAVPEFIGSGGDNPSTQHNKSLFYIDAYEMLGWVTAQGVAILNPS